MHSTGTDGEGKERGNHLTQVNTEKLCMDAHAVTYWFSTTSAWTLLTITVCLFNHYCHWQSFIASITVTSIYNINSNYTIVGKPLTPQSQYQSGVIPDRGHVTTVMWCDKPLADRSASVHAQLCRQLGGRLTLLQWRMDHIHILHFPPANTDPLTAACSTHTFSCTPQWTFR